jgi:hypothetical protein
MLNLSSQKYSNLGHKHFIPSNKNLRGMKQGFPLSRFHGFEIKLLGSKFYLEAGNHSYA